MPTKGERGKATDFSIAAIMAPRGPSFGHYHLQGIGNAAATANTSLECPTGKAFVANSHLDHRFWVVDCRSWQKEADVSSSVIFLLALRSWNMGPPLGTPPPEDEDPTISNLSD
ncbi:hypothetical protein WN51_08531 [Melipona quadrifasciata]|uniref:Uncharacterized protein n=1 Tax=Melipona quadrifasciata TaxID=166423 RepID=A0A0N0BJB6_9HYME|nr:hypothetical protein WN51_08531 [Melipona quadrifasciata]